MKRFAHLLVLAALILLGHAASATAVTIMVGDNFYSPQTVAIHAGDVVTWQYQGPANTHPTASDNGAWVTFTMNSANLSHSITFSTVGSFPYHCNFHGAPGVGMFGVITVSAALPTRSAQLDAALRVYPNPAHEVVTLAVDHAQIPHYSAVQFINAVGSLVRTVELSAAEADHDLTINVADLPAGIYVYRLLAENRIIANQRMVLLR